MAIPKAARALVRFGTAGATWNLNQNGYYAHNTHKKKTPVPRAPPGPPQKSPEMLGGIESTSTINMWEGPRGLRPPEVVGGAAFSENTGRSSVSNVHPRAFFFWRRPVLSCPPAARAASTSGGGPCRQGLVIVTHGES